MQAVLLAGGKGTRLRPYTISFPKPLVPVGDYPILEIVIRQLASHGVKDILISTGHLAELIEAYFGNGKKWGVSIRYVREEKPLNTAGALKLIHDLDENFLVMNGDILTALDYSKLFKTHLDQKAAATIATTERDVGIDFGVIHATTEGFLTEYIEKPVHHFAVSMGVYALAKSSISHIKEDEAISMPDLFLRLHQNRLPVYCYRDKSYWLDIGRPDDYQRAQEEFEKKKSELLPELKF